MHGYFDESGNSQLQKGALFVVAAIWIPNSKELDSEMRKWLRNLKIQGYRLNEIKGSELTNSQRTKGLERIANSGLNVKADIVLLSMNSLISNYRLHQRTEITESIIHQSQIFEICRSRINSNPTDPAVISIDQRHTVTSTFVKTMQASLRKDFRSNNISVNSVVSHNLKGIQLADVCSNLCYRIFKDNQTSSEPDIVENMKKSLFFDSNVRFVTNEQLLNYPAKTQNSGGQK